MSEAKHCPFCGEEPFVSGAGVECLNEDCPISNWGKCECQRDARRIDIKKWNTRPIEEELQKKLAYTGNALLEKIKEN